ncbi:hypothetical protein BN2537_41 [Streptomyces venezuelae]|nr:hypothetical protein BN2537_41 [Streptomyces venezuelae]
MWFWLTVGVLESLPGRVRLGQVTAAARTAAAEIELPVTQSRTELSALAAGLRQLCDYGVLEELEGRVEALMDGGEDPPVLLKVHHTRLLHVLPRGVQVDEWGSGPSILARTRRGGWPGSRGRLTRGCGCARCSPTRRWCMPVIWTRTSCGGSATRAPPTVRPWPGLSGWPWSTGWRERRG